MPTDVVMPQMGESIFEGTITKWLKKPGDKVNRDEPLFEISTDKVDAEIPSPAAGVLKEIKVPEGNTVQVNTVVGTIAAEGEAAGAPASPAQAPAATEKTAPAAPPPEAAKPAAPQAPARPPEPAKTAATTTGGAVSTEGPSKPEPAEAAAKPKEREAAAQQKTVVEFPHAAEGEGERLRSSPLVRRMARENQVDLNQVRGTGLGGRITKEDIQQFIEQRPMPGQRPAAAASAGPQVAQPA